MADSVLAQIAVEDFNAPKRGREMLPAHGVAEREGFEPSIRFPVYTLSKRAP